MQSKMDEKYLVSVIVPVYKVERYLEKCVDSILSQTYTNLEIILVDDGSPDRCGEMCDEYATKDDRVRVIHRENGGLSAARNSGMDIATGDFIMFVDSDDWIEPNAVATCINEIIIEEHKGIKVDVLYFSYYEVLESKGLEKTPKWTDPKYIGKVYDSETFWLHYMEDISSLHKAVWGKCFRRASIGRLRFQEGIKGEDGVFMLEFYATSSNPIIKVIGNSLYNYRISREGSITNISLQDIYKGALEGYYRIFDNLAHDSYNALSTKQSSSIVLLRYVSTYILNYFVDQYKYVVSLRLPQYADSVDLFEEWLPTIRKMPLSKEAKTYRKLRLFQLSPWLYTTIMRLKHRK